MTLAIKKGQIPTLKNAAIAWAENKKEADKYSSVLEHLEKWLALGEKKTKDISEATYDFGDALKEAKEAIERIKFDRFQKELEDIYDSLKNVEIAEEDLGLETEEMGNIWASVLDQTGLKMAGINVQAQETFNSMAEYYQDLANRWQATYEESIMPTYEQWGDLLNEFYGQIEKFCREVDAHWNNMTDSMVDAFMEWGEGTTNILDGLRNVICTFADDVIRSMGRMLMEMYMATIKEWALNKIKALAAGIASIMKKLSFPLNVLAIGGMIALVTAAFAKIKKFEKGGRVPSRQIVEVAEKEPEWIIPESRMGEFAQKYEKREGRRRFEPMVQLEPATINLNIDGKTSSRLILKYAYELTKDGIVKIHVRGITDK